MKKMTFSFMASLMVSAFAFSNTMEIKEIDQLKEIALSSKVETKERILEICYETERSTTQHPSGVSVTTVTYQCYQHPEFPGSGTVYIAASN